MIHKYTYTHIRYNIDGTGFITDGDVQSQDFCHTIIEAKNKIGSKGAEPHAQAILYYVHTTKSSVVGIPWFYISLHSDSTLRQVLSIAPLAISTDHILLQAPISDSQLLFGALARTYRCFRLLYLSFGITPTPKCEPWLPVIWVP